MLSGNQWRSLSTGVMWSCRLAFNLPLDKQHGSEHVEAFQSDSSASCKEASCSCPTCM